MNALPQDVYDEICGFLSAPNFNLSAVATVSRRWQAAIERRTFRTIRVRSDDFDRFHKIVHGSRRRCVTKVEYIVILPPYSEEDRCRFEREIDREENDKVFTQAIHGLFHILKLWDVCEDGSIELKLVDVYSDTDHDFLRRSSPSRQLDTWLRLKKDETETYNVDLWGWRFHFSYLRLLKTSELPVVPVVKSFRTAHLTRNICDRVSIDIAARLPNLREAFCLMNEWEIRYIGLRRRHRQDLSEAVSQTLPQASGLVRLHLHTNQGFFPAPNFSTTSLHPESQTHDTLCTAIRKATGSMTKLKDLHVSGVLDESLLTPSPTQTFQEPYWQNLARLIIRFSPRRPSGGFYFHVAEEAITIPGEDEVPPCYGNDEEDAAAAIEFQITRHSGFTGRVQGVSVPEDESILPLFEAFGRACCQIPPLQSACLLTHVRSESGSGARFQDLVPWGVSYTSPGVWPWGGMPIPETAFSDCLDTRRLFWNTLDWRPTTTLQDLLRNIGGERHGGRLVERFLGSEEAI